MGRLLSRSATVHRVPMHRLALGVNAVLVEEGVAVADAVPAVQVRAHHHRVAAISKHPSLQCREAAHQRGLSALQVAWLFPRYESNVPI